MIIMDYNKITKIVNEGMNGALSFAKDRTSFSGKGKEAELSRLSAERE